MGGFFSLYDKHAKITDVRLRSVFNTAKNTSSPVIGRTPFWARPKLPPSTRAYILPHSKRTQREAPRGRGRTRCRIWRRRGHTPRYSLPAEAQNNGVEGIRAKGARIPPAVLCGAWGLGLPRTAGFQRYRALVALRGAEARSGSSRTKGARLQEHFNQPCW